MEALAALLPQGGPLSLDDATLIEQFKRIPTRSPHTAKYAERIQLQGIAEVASDLQLRAPLSQRPCLAYSVAVRTRPQIFAALLRAVAKVPARGSRYAAATCTLTSIQRRCC
jgi:hypothetical protein